MLEKARSNATELLEEVNNWVELNDGKTWQKARQGEEVEKMSDQFNKQPLFIMPTIPVPEYT